MLANLGSGASERRLEPGSDSPETRPPLELSVGEEQLNSIERLADSGLILRVNNRSQDAFSRVSLTLRVFSEDTTLTSSRYYQAEVSDLQTGNSERVRFPLELTTASNSRGSNTYAAGKAKRSRVVLEVQATTPEGISAVKTIVLPFPKDGST